MEEGILLPWNNQPGGGMSISNVTFVNFKNACIRGCAHCGRGGSPYFGDGAFETRYPPTFLLTHSLTRLLAIMRGVEAHVHTATPALPWHLSRTRPCPCTHFPSSICNDLRQSGTSVGTGLQLAARGALPPYRHRLVLRLL